MLLFRHVLFVSFVALCWGSTVSAQMTPMQSPPFSVQNGAPAYQAPAYPSAPPAAPPGTAYSQPIRVASTNPAPTGQSISLYDPGNMNRPPQVIQPGAAQETPQGMVPPGRIQPANTVTPFSLTPVEQKELDEFLARWERYSTNIKRYDVDFNMFEYDPTIPGTQPGVAQRTLFGNFRYISNPKRFLYVVEGEHRDGKYVKRDGDKNPDVFAEKIIIDERTITKYDYNAKIVRQINVPAEMIGKGIADSPLPLIFGAKADDLKRRFSMKVVLEQNGYIRLFARPLMIEDQGEFKELVVLLDKELRAKGLQQWDINDKSYKVYQLTSTKINDRMGVIMDDVKAFFTPSIERGWKHEVHDLASPSPPAVSAVPQVQIAQPQQQPFRNDTTLYRGQ